MEVGSLVKAIYDFSPEDDQDLPLCIGDIVQITQRIDKQWCRGKSNNVEGNFPLNFVVELKIPWHTENQPLFAPICDFTAQETGDLSFKKGDLIVGLHAVGENWWKGQLNGACGIFPLTHVWKINHDILPKINEPKKLNLKARVKMSLKAKLDEEIDLEKDEIVLITEEVEKGWYRGECNNKRGIFPTSFVTIINEDAETILPVNNAHLSNGNTLTRNSNSYQYGYDCLNSGITAYGCAICSFHSDHPGDLNFNQSEIVNLIRHIDENWMEGEIDGRRGIFPKNYINIIVDCDTTKTDEPMNIHQDDQMFPPDTYGRVLSSFPQANNSSHLMEGDTVTLIRKVKNNFYEVLTDNLESILCPANSIEVIGSGPEALPPSYSDVMKDSYYSNVTLSRKSSQNGFIKNDRPLSYPSFHQSSFNTPLSSKSNTMKSFSSVDEKIAENLGQLNISHSSETNNNQSFSGRSFSVSNDSGYSEKEYHPYRNRLASSPLPTISASGGESPFDSWNDSSSSPSYANISSEEFSNVWKESSKSTPLNVEKQIQQKEEQLKRLTDSKTKLQNKGKIESNFVNSEIQQQINHLEIEIKNINQEITELKDKVLSSNDDSGICSESESAKRDSESAQKRELDQRRRASERKKKMHEQRNCVIMEIIQTESDYLADLQMLYDTFLRNPEEAKAKGIDTATVFGNLDEVIAISHSLLAKLRKLSKSNSQTQMIGECFVDMADNLREIYGHYCRNHDEVNAVLDKYHEKTAAGQFLKHKIEALKRQTNCFDLPSMLIKPVQRILKYPLLLNELVKCTDDNHPDKQMLIKAIGLMTTVATDINEFKRRQDLVSKYRDNAATSLTERFSKLNFHTLQKKTARFGVRFCNTFGLSSVMKDERFTSEQQQFRALEKAIKIFLEDLTVYLGKEEELVTTAHVIAEDIAQLYGESQSQPEVKLLRSVHQRIRVQFWDTFKQNVEINVQSILRQLLKMFVGPNNLIQKRGDKLLDYEACTNKLEKNKDATKLLMLQENQRMAKNTYEALNSQLLDDLPKLYSTSVEIFHDCLCYFLKIKKSYFSRIAEEMQSLKELPLLLGSQGEILETFQIKHTLVTDNLCQMHLVPKELFSASSGTLKRNSSPRSSNIRLGGKIATKVSQTSKHVLVVKSAYPNALYYAVQDHTASDLYDLNLKKGDIVGLVKDKDPMGNNLKWFVDNGVAKGFVPAKCLKRFSVPQANKNIAPAASNTRNFSSAKPIEPQKKSADQIKQHKNASLIVPVRPVPLPPSTNKSSSVAVVPVPPKPVPNNPEVHRYEEIDEIPENCDRYDAVSEDPAPNLSYSEFDPYSPITDQNQLYDNVPSDSSVQNEECHRYEVVPEEKKPEEYYFSRYDFTPRRPNEMQLTVGQTVLVLQKCDFKGQTEWWFVEDRYGKQGFVPGNYLELHPQQLASSAQQP